METCGMSCIKYILFFFNFLFALSGIGIITAGSVSLRAVEPFYHFVNSRTIAPPIVLIVVGVIVFIVAFLGCCGAIRESYNMLIAFAVLLIVIFIVELAVGIAAAVNKDAIKDELEEELKKSKNRYESEVWDRKAWHTLQTTLMCCGVDGPKDWDLGGNVPESCCKEKSDAPNREDALCSNSNSEKIHQDGCLEKLTTTLKDGAVILMGGGFGIAFIEVAGAVLACFLAHAIKKEEGEPKD